MAAGTQAGIVGGIRIDLKRLHETWMELIYPRQRDADDTVLGKWTPDTQEGMIAYRAWSALGVPIIALVYPLVLFGAFVRFQTRRLDSTVTRLGIVGVLVLMIVLWGGLTVLAKVQFQDDLAAGGVTAVAVASAVAVVSAGLAVGSHRIGGRGTTVLLAYPFGVTAIFLPPVVAALYSPTVANVVIPSSDALARWLLYNVLDVGGINEYLIENYERQGAAYALMWLGISVPVGWLLGLFVTLADLVRPTE
ncbi:MAG: hypothetical protein ABEH35_04545 [Haloarculaceae archaeon]